jgi:DNA primase large subunit
VLARPADSDGLILLVLIMAGLSFLHAIGMDSEEIMKLFSAAPDFREDMTRYQVEHITGKTSGTEYSPPGCQAMKTYSICYNEDDWCRRERPDGSGRYVNHPLSYYKWALKRKARATGNAPPAPAPSDRPQTTTSP